MSKIDQLDKNDIKQVSCKTIRNWEWMISKGRKLSETTIDVNDMGYNIENNNPVGTLERICGEIVMEKDLFSPIKKNQIGDNLQTHILCNIIEKHLLLNYFQRIVVEKTLYNLSENFFSWIKVIRVDWIH